MLVPGSSPPGAARAMGSTARVRHGPGDGAGGRPVVEDGAHMLRMSMPALPLPTPRVMTSRFAEAVRSCRPSNAADPWDLRVSGRTVRPMSSKSRRGTAWHPRDKHDGCGGGNRPGAGCAVSPTSPLPACGWSFRRAPQVGPQHAGRPRAQFRQAFCAQPCDPAVVLSRE